MAGPLVDYLPALRIVGGALLIVLGLNLAGILRIPVLERTWRPLDAGAVGIAGDGDRDDGPRLRRRVGRPPASATGWAAALVSPRGGWLASFGLGAIFAIGWTPCIGIILGGILTMAATSRHRRPGRDPAARLHARARAPVHRASRSSTTGRRALVRPLVRHGRTVSLIGGLLVAVHRRRDGASTAALLPRYFKFNTAI